MNVRAFFLTILLLAVPAPRTQAIVLMGAVESDNLVAPTNGAPWDYVARLDNQFGARATGVYLGNRYVLTANHVDADINKVHLNGADYTLDASFAPLVVGGTDLRLHRIVNDPGLPALPLIGTTDPDLNQPVTFIGYGVGKATEVPGQGWNWADDASRLKRWGVNATLAEYHTLPQSSFVYVQTEFDMAAGSEEAQLTVGDSGCGLFQQHGGTWKLAAIGADVDTLQKALYDKDLTTPGHQPDRSSSVVVRPHATELKQIRSGYAAWAASFASNPGLTGANPDGDTFNNLLEFAFGLDPQASSPVSLSTTPTVVRGGSVAQAGTNPAQLNALYVRRDDHLTAGLIYTVQFSADLVSWLDSAATPVLVADSGEYEIVSVPFPADPGQARFFRVVVTMN